MRFEVFRRDGGAGFELEGTEGEAGFVFLMVCTISLVVGTIIGLITRSAA